MAANAEADEDEEDDEEDEEEGRDMAMALSLLPVARMCAFMTRMRLYQKLCMGASGHSSRSSRFGGRPRSTSRLRRRSTRICIRRHTLSTSERLVRAMSLASKASWNMSALANTSLCRQLSSAQHSLRLFCTGVPVRKMDSSRVTRRQALATIVSSFLTW